MVQWCYRHIGYVLDDIVYRFKRTADHNSKSRALTHCCARHTDCDSSFATALDVSDLLLGTRRGSRLSWIPTA